LAVALREAREESGLQGVRAVMMEIFDVDRHWIPERGAEAGHYHYDVRFLLEADPQEPLVVSSESKDLAWIPLARVAQLNPEESLMRMVRKTR
jgi:8-oxo-dGTP pyrophosphatase MutT (NUDIX family)